jgi:thiamine biosynthesis lipoprotein
MFRRSLFCFFGGRQMKLKLRTFGAITLISLVILGLGVRLTERGNTQLFELTGRTMGTTYSIKLVEFPEGISPEHFADSIDTLLYRLDKELMSTYAPESELSRLNAAAVGLAVTVSNEMIAVLSLAATLSELTHGAFDVTVGPLVNRWGFGPTKRRTELPSDSELAALLSRVDYRNIRLDTAANQVTKLADVAIDLSGIAKGYGVDQVAQFFDDSGIDSYFVEIGGELRIKGYKPGQQSWVPAIEKPVDTAPQVHNIFYANGESIAVAGSGDYRNYFDLDGVHYSHEIDPVTGRPVTHNLAAVYVIDTQAARADALATAFMVMGEEAAFVLAQSEGLAVYFISKRVDNDGFEDRYTTEFEHYLKLQ